jgi:hypothetical protein
MSSGKKCPNCGEVLLEPDHPMNEYYEILPHENKDNCIKYLKSMIRSLEMRIEDIEHALTK